MTMASTRVSSPRSRRIEGAVVAGVAVVLALILGVGAPAQAATRSVGSHPHRVLIVSVPTLTWSDLDSGDAPNLSRFLDAAAIADLATRADRQPAKLGAAYVTIGAGTRAAGDETTDGEGLAVTEPYGTVNAGAVYRQRTGAASGGGIVNLGIARVDGANASLLYGAQPGALGDALTTAGYSRSVVANGDGSQPDGSGAGTPLYFRSAVGALMDRAGRLAQGHVGPGLLRHDATAPFGERLDPARVEQAFLNAWHPRSVVLVEASDLVRADRAAGDASDAGKAMSRRNAIRWSDQLFGRLLAHVNLADDEVLVVAPVPPTGNRSVTVAGLRGPGIAPGLLRSATTRRSGFVTLADVAPTVLDRLALPTPESMEGRPMLDDRGHGSAADRRAMLERANADGLLRDDLVNPVTATVLWMAIALAVGCVLLLVVRRSILERYAWTPRLVQWVALAMIGFVAATSLATLFHFGEHGGKGAYWLFVLTFAAAFAAFFRLVGRRGRLDPLIGALILLLALLVMDQYTGAHLEFNSVFGYSATVGIRFSGIGNQSSALLTTAALLVASLLAWRLPIPRGTRLASVALAVSFVAITPPLFGQDFGGTLAAAPAFALLGWLLLGRRLTVKAVVSLLGILLASGLIVGFLDLLRPSDQRTHVGRFFEKVGNEGFSGFSTVIERKGGENAATFSNQIYVVLIVVVLAAGVALWLRAPRPLATVVDAVPTLRAGAIALLTLVVLSYALNDSGLAIPAIMLSLVAAAGAYMVAGSPGPSDPPTGSEPARSDCARTSVTPE